MLAKNSAIYLLARVFPAIFSFSSIALLTRLLPPESYGAYALIMSAAIMSGTVFFTWNSHALLRSYSEFSNRRQQLFSTALFGFMGAWVIAVLVSLLVYAVVGPFVQLATLFVVLVLAGGFAWIELVGRILNAGQNPFGYAFLLFCRAGTVLVAGGAAAYWSDRPEVVAGAIAAGYFVAGLLPTFSRWLKEVNLSAADSKLMIDLFRYGFPLSLATALMQIVGALDRWMLAWLTDNKTVAEYAVGYDVAQFTIVAIGSALNLAFFPQILNALHSSGMGAAKKLLSSYSLTLLSVMLPASAGFAILAGPLTDVLVGQELRAGAVPIIPWICGAMFFAVLKAFYTDYAFQIGRWTYGTTLTALSTLVINFGLNLYLIPRWGAIGAAQASLVSFLAAFLLSTSIGWVRGFKLPGLRLEHLKPLIATVLMILALGLIPEYDGVFGLFLTILVGVLVYMALSIVLDIHGIRKYLKDRLMACVSRR